MMTAAELEQLNRRLKRIGIRPLKPTREQVVLDPEAELSRDVALERQSIVRRGIGQVTGVR